MTPLYGLNFTPYTSPGEGNLPPTLAPAGRPGAPTIELTYVPPVGSFEDLRGRVLHADPRTYAVASYIRVRGRWWSKPTWDAPLTTIVDGTFQLRYASGGIDEQADRIVVVLVGTDVRPPLAYGEPDLPLELATTAVTRAEAVRGT